MPCGVSSPSMCSTLTPALRIQMSREVILYDAVTQRQADEPAILGIVFDVVNASRYAFGEVAVGLPIRPQGVLAYESASRRVFYRPREVALAERGSYLVRRHSFDERDSSDSRWSKG